jgi:hypothetical protein
MKHDAEMSLMFFFVLRLDQNVVNEEHDKLV